MKLEELISVIVPVYKVEKYLERCIQSIVEQTYSNLEIILVDDGSPDKCPLICDSWKVKDNRIRVIHKENGGLSDARNAGMAIATGEYIAFVDSDDYIEKDMYEKLYMAIKHEKADVAICNLQKVLEDGTLILEKSPLKHGVFNGIECLKTLADSSIPGWYYVTVWNKLYRRNILDGIEFPVNKIHEDEFIIHKVFFRCKKIVILEDKLYKYVQRSGSIMSASQKVNTLDAIEAICERLQFYEDNKLFELQEDSIKRLKMLYNTRRLSEIQLNNRAEKRRLKAIDKMFKETYFKYVKDITLNEQVKYTFPSLWCALYRIYHRS